MPDDSFVPDSFEPDTEQDSFVPDSFVPDKPGKKKLSESDFETVEVAPGQFMSRLKGETTEAAQKRVAGSTHDSTWLGGVTDFFEGLRQRTTNRLAEHPNLAVLSAGLLEIPRNIAEMGSTAEGILLPKTDAGILEAGPKPTYESPLNDAMAAFRYRNTQAKALLPGHEDPFLAGPGGIQRSSLITPQEEARLAGYPNDTTAPLAVGSRGQAQAVDLAELQERERLARLNYGQFEHTGGTALTLPDRPPSIPSEPFSTRMSFNEVGTGEGAQYPLNVVPNALQPRQQQTIFEATIPEGMKGSEGFVEPTPVTFESGIAEKPPVVKPEVRPEQGVLPSATKAENPLAVAGRAKWRAAKGIPEPEIQSANSTTGLKIENATIPPNTPPIVKTAVEDGVKALVQESKKPSYLLKSIYTQLGELGPKGRELVQRFQRAAQNRSEYDAAWTEPLFSIGAKLSKVEHANFGAYVEGRIPVPNQRVQAAVDAWKQSQNMAGDMAVSEGLHLKRGGDTIPFQKMGGDYWPHIPNENLTKKDIVDRLVTGGMSRYDAVRVAKRWSDTGEIVIGPQHTRLKETFPYKDDFDVAIQHGRSMSKRIANHKNLGPKDIAGKGDEGIADLIEDTTDKKLAFKLAQRLAGRDERPSDSLMRGLNQARKWMSLTSLANFTLKNPILGQAMNAQMALVSNHPIQAVKEVSQLFRSAYRSEIRASGVYNSFNRSLVEELQGIDPFLIGAGEKINRAVAAAIGRSAVKTALEDFKAGTNMKSARYFLETLLSRPAESITEITPELERFAAGRMAEITQGLNNPGNLPYGWSSPVNTYGSFAGQLFLIFKKVGFQVTKTVKDSIKANPVVAIPAWLAISQVAGEMSGDVGSALTGKERPEELVNRIADNWANAHMVGLPWDLATSAQYGPSALAMAALGPAYGKASELGADVYQTGKNLMDEDNEDPFKQLRSFGLRNLPIPGRERIAKSYNED